MVDFFDNIINLIRDMPEYYKLIVSAFSLLLTLLSLRYMIKGKKDAKQPISWLGLAGVLIFGFLSIAFAVIK